MTLSKQLTIQSLFKKTTNNEISSVKVPGKLFITGEYAILFPKQPAIIIAVDQFLTANVTPSQQTKAGVITTDLSELTPLEYVRIDGQFHVDSNVSSSWHYAINAVNVAEALLHSLDIPISNYNIHFNSDLVNKDGLKFGLGSSGAIVVATIKGLLNFHGVNALDNETIFKLAAIALTLSKSNGSLADIATITTGGWVYYQSFDRQWLKNQVEAGTPVDTILLTDWPDLIIESLNVPDDLALLIGWTQSPASTDNLVGQLLERYTKHDEAFNLFLKNAATSVERMRIAFNENNLATIQTEIRTYRQLLIDLAKAYQLNIETTKLTQFIESALPYTFSAKSSGAGGGDCGIAIGHKDASTEALIKEWELEDIVALPLQVTPPFSIETT